MTQVDKGIAIPERMKYPFMSMDVGDSFAVKADGEKDSRRLQRSVVSYAYRFKKLGMAFTSRQLIENGSHVIRVWRTA